MTWAEFIPALVVALLPAFVIGALVGSALARRRGGVLTPERTPMRPTAPARLVPIGGCRECGAPLGGGHTGYCSKSQMRGGSGGVVTEADCRHLTVGDMGMG